MSAMHASSHRAPSSAVWKGALAPIAFTSFLSGGTDLQALPLRLMYTSALSLHPHSCDVLLTDLTTRFSSPPATTVLRYALPYPPNATEKIPGRTVPKYTCNNRLATEATFLSEVAAGRHSCAGSSRFHIALLDSDILMVGSLARLFQEQIFSVAFTARSHPSMPINNGMRLISGRSNESLTVASRFYNHWFGMVRLMEQASRKPLSDESFMHGPVFWHEQKAVALLLGYDHSNPISLAPFQPAFGAALAPPGAVLILPASNFCFGLPARRPGSRGETHPCDNEHLRPRCGVHAIHFKAENKCMMLEESCLRLAGLNATAAADLRARARLQCRS